MSDRLRVSSRGGITEIVFDHPPINIYDVATRDELCEVLAGVLADPGVRVVLFTAAGDHFSAGADLKEFGTAPSLWAMRDARWGRDVWGLLRAVEVPMLASMHGYAVGFGFELALQCDYRLAADDCVVALPEARVGMIPAGGASQTLPRVAGTSSALATILLSDRIPAHDALRRGFLDEVVPRAELRARTDELTEQIAGRPTAAVRAAKALRGLPSTSRSPKAWRANTILPPSSPAVGAHPRSSLPACLLQEGPVGPFPPGKDPDEYDRLRRRVLWTMPSGLYVLGSTDKDEQRNGMTLNWATQMSFAPKMLAVGIEITAFTHELVSAGRVFSLNIIDREDRAIVRKFTKPVEVDLAAQTLNGFPFHDGLSGAPILDQAVAYVDCEVRESVVVGEHTLFLGEIVDAGFQKPEDTPVLRMEDTRMNYGG